MTQDEIISSKIFLWRKPAWGRTSAETLMAFQCFREEYYHLVKNLRNFPYFLLYFPCLEKWKNGYFSHFLFLLALLMPKWSNTIFIFFLSKINKENSIYWKSENLRKPQIWQNPTLVSWPPVNSFKFAKYKGSQFEGPLFSCGNLRPWL